MKHKTKPRCCSSSSHSFALSEIKQIGNVTSNDFSAKKKKKKRTWLLSSLLWNVVLGQLSVSRSRVSSTALWFENGQVGNTGDCCSRGKTQQKGDCVQAQTSQKGPSCSCTPQKSPQEQPSFALGLEITHRLQKERLLINCSLVLF